MIEAAVRNQEDYKRGWLVATHPKLSQKRRAWRAFASPGGTAAIYSTLNFDRKIRGASGMQDHLAYRLAADEHFQGVGGLHQREGAVDM